MIPRLLFACALGCALVSSLPAALTQPVVPAAPSIPAMRASPADFGAVPDGETLNTAAFARALDTLAARRAHVAGCIVDTGDDGLCLKSGINESGRRLGAPTEDVLIEDCTVYEGHGGFTIGSEMSGGVRNVLVRNGTFIGTALGLRFKTARGRGGLVENVHLRGIRMTGIEGSAIDFNFFYFSEAQVGRAVPPADEGTPVFRNLLFEDIVSRGAKRQRAPS